VVLKQELVDQVLAQPGGGVVVTPEFWLSLLWKTVMGRTVLAVIGDSTGTVRVYAHLEASKGTVTAVIINTGDSPANVTLQSPSAASKGRGRGDVATATISAASKGRGGGDVATATIRNEFHVTAYPVPTNLTATGVALNGDELVLGPAGLPPSFEPATALRSQAVVVQPYSVVFCVYANV
jgi:hypothetical protein